MVYKINHNFYIREHWNFVFVNNCGICLLEIKTMGEEGGRERGRGRRD